MKKNQNGFAHVGLVLMGVLVIFVIGFAGWKVYDNNKTKPAATSNVTKSEPKKAEESPTQDKAKVPANYVVYENKEVGFKFAYPKEWGTIIRSGDDAPSMILNGLNGHVLRTSFEDGDTSVLPRGNQLNGDTAPGTDEGHYGGGYIQKDNKYYSVLKYSAEEIQIPTDRIKAEVQSELGTVLIINAGTIAGNRIQLLLNLPSGKSLSGLDLIFKNSNEDFTDESGIDDKGLETLKTVARSFEAI